VIVHDVKTLKMCDIFLHENAVLCISVHPAQSQIFATACESGELSLYDLRISNTTPIILATTSSTLRSLGSSSSYSSSCARYMGGGAFNSCSFNPIEPNLIAAANEISGVSLVDIRMKKTIMRYKTTASGSPIKKLTDYKQNVMSVRFNSNGTHIAALRSKLRPVLYALNDDSPAYVFDHEEFKNSCTLKSCCFAGNNDQYFVSGSDDFGVYIWKIPDLLPFNVEENVNNKENVLNDESDDECEDAVVDQLKLFTSNKPKFSSKSLISEAHLKLTGHRSIVNQCRYNKSFHLLATSGIEKIIKIWAPYKMPGNCRGGLKGTLDEFAPKRKLYTYKDLFSFRLTNNQQTNVSIAASNTSSEGNTSSRYSSFDSNDLAISNYEPVIRNRHDTETNNESLEEDKIMIAFFDSQVRRQQQLMHETIRDRHTKKRKFKRAGLSSHEEENSLSTIEEDFYYDTDTDLNSTKSTRKNSSTNSTIMSDSDSKSNKSSSGTENDSESESDSDSSDDLRTTAEKCIKSHNNKPLLLSTTSSSSSSSSSSNDEYGQVMDDEADINVDELLKKASSSGEKKNLFDLNLDLINERINENNKKRLMISLRDRIRNLRHRQTLNLTQQTDYVNVLNSLSVSNNTNELVEGVPVQIVEQEREKNEKINLFEENGAERARGAGVRSTIECDKNLEISKEKSDDNEAKALYLSKREMIKSLNEQKRKIENDEDFDETAKKDLCNDESSQNSSTKFSFFKRKKNSSNKDDDSKN
jgi:hypothetical protein